MAAHNDDDVNLAVCRLAGEKGVLATAVAAEPERLDDYGALGVAAVSPDSLAARRMVSMLDRRREFSAAIAGGMAEGMDFRVVADSPVRGNPLQRRHRPKGGWWCRWCGTGG